MVCVSPVKPRVLWRLVYLVPVVAGCDCSWRWVSGAQAASCSAGVRIPMAECGRVVLNQWTHSAVASTGGVDVLPGSLVADELGLVQRVERLGQSIVVGIPFRAYRGDCLAVGQGLPVANGPVLHPTVASGAPGPSGQHRFAFVARRPFSGRPGPGRCTLAGRWSASR